MWNVIVFPITGPLKGFVFPDAIQQLFKEFKEMPEEERANAVRVSLDESEGYMLAEGDWSAHTVAGAEIHGPFETPQAAKAWVNERAKRWTQSGSAKEQ